NAPPARVGTHGRPKAARGGEPGAVGQFAGRAESHRRGGIEEEVEAEILLVHEQLHVEPVEPAVDVPVDVAEIIAQPVGPVVGELDADAFPGTASLALD